MTRYRFGVQVTYPGQAPHVNSRHATCAAAEKEARRMAPRARASAHDARTVEVVELPPQPTLRNVRRVAERLGATVEVRTHGRTYEVLLEAPSGHVWAGSGLHELVGSVPNGPAAWREEMYADHLERMAYGVEECVDPNCEWCYEEGGRLRPLAP